MVVKFFTFEQYHKKKNVGSTNIRVHNLIKNWPESSIYKYGEKMDVMIFQKIYCTYDYKFPKNLKAIKILDVCDPDWFNTPDIYIKETIDSMDAVVTPTKTMMKYLQQMTDTPVRVIKDRFDLTKFPKKKIHKDKAKTVVWFGYSHNAELLRFAVPSLEKRELDLIVVADEDPFAYRWANSSAAYRDKYEFIKWNDNAYTNIQKADICVLPKGYRPYDKFKSENKTIIAQLLGLPVVSDADELDKLLDAESRTEYIDNVYDKIRKDYDCQVSVKEYKELIDEIKK